MPQHHAELDSLVVPGPAEAPEGGLCPGHWGCSAPGIAPRKAARVLGLFLPAGVLQEREGGETTGTAEKCRWTLAGTLPCLGFPRPREYVPDPASSTPGLPPGSPRVRSRGGDSSGRAGELAHAECRIARESSEQHKAIGAAYSSIS